MTKRISLRELLEKEELVICPEVYDCASSKAVEMSGFQTILLSSGELSCSMLGVPDMGLLTLDEVVFATDRITKSCPLPLIIDAEDGYGQPLNVYHTCKRLAAAGASGILITDQSDVGKPGVLPIKDAVAKFKAAHEALKDTDCMLIARCDLNPEGNLDEAIERCNRYREVGADMTLIVKLAVIKGDRLAMCKEIAARVPGWKMYPDLGSTDGVPHVELDDIAKLGFKLVGVHYLLHSAMLAMLDTGRNVFETHNNLYVEEHYKDTGFAFRSPSELFGLRDNYWVNLEKSFDDSENLLSERISKFFLEEL